MWALFSLATTLTMFEATVYEQRKAGNDEDICEDDVTKLENVPIFYQYEVRLLDSPPPWAVLVITFMSLNYWECYYI